MVSGTVYAVIAIAVIIPIAFFTVYSTTLGSEPTEQPIALAVNDTPKMFVLSSFYPIEQFVSKVGGNKIDSQLILPPGAEPHDWEPTVRDVQNIQDADIIVINGLGFETWVDDLDSAGFDGLLVDTSYGIETMETLEGELHRHGDEHETDEHETDEHETDEHGDEKLVSDPHIWLSPVLAQIQVQHIADAMAESDPDNAAYYQANADDFIEELQQLDSDIRTTLEPCSNEFIAFHQAFTYLAAEYNLIQHSIVQSTTPYGEVALGTLERVINTARQHNIDVIFTEEAADPRTAQVVADEINGRVLTLSPLEIGVHGNTYISTMYQNLENLEIALCQN